MSEQMFLMVRDFYQSALKSNNMIEKYAALTFFSYLKELLPKDGDIDMFYQSINANFRCFSDEFERYEIYLQLKEDSFIGENMTFFEELLPKLDLNYESVPSIKMNYDDLMELLFSFAKSISNDFYAFVNKTLSEGRIFRRNSEFHDDVFDIAEQEENGFYCAVFSKPEVYFAYINRFDTIMSLSVLIHEIGHLYYHYLDLNESTYYEPESKIKSEIPTRIMELLFIKYLDSRHLYYLSDILKRIFANNLNANQKNSNLIIRYKYLLANFVASEFSGLINEKVSLEEFFGSIQASSYKDILVDTRKYYDMEHQKDLRKAITYC